MKNWLSITEGKKGKERLCLSVASELCDALFHTALFSKEELFTVKSKWSALVIGEALKMRPIPSVRSHWVKMGGGAEVQCSLNQVC